MDEAGANPPQVEAELPESPEPPTLPAPPALAGPPSPPIDAGARTPLVAIARKLPTAYRSSATRGTVAMALVGIAVAAYAVQTVAQLSQLGILDAAAAGTLTTAEAEASDALVLGLGGVAAGAYLLSAVAVLAWLWRAVGNIPMLTARAFAWSHIAAVGWWFAPFANWVMPYRVVRDAVQELGAGASATIVTAWWVCHAGSSIASWLIRIGGRSSLGSGADPGHGGRGAILLWRGQHRSVLQANLQIAGPSSGERLFLRHPLGGRGRWLSGLSSLRAEECAQTGASGPSDR